MERDSNVSFEVVRIIQAVIILLITAEALLAFWQSRRAQRQSTVDSQTTEQPKPIESPGVSVEETGANV